MENVREEMGEGTLYDTGDAELADVAYRIQPGPKLEGTPETWGGDLFFADEALTVDPGLYVLALEDGTRVDIDINPASVEDGDPRQVTFRGVGPSDSGSSNPEADSTFPVPTLSTRVAIGLGPIVAPTLRPGCHAGGKRAEHRSFRTRRLGSLVVRRWSDDLAAF